MVRGAAVSHRLCCYSRRNGKHDSSHSRTLSLFLSLSFGLAVVIEGTDLSYIYNRGSRCGSDGP